MRWSMASALRPGFERGVTDDDVVDLGQVLVHAAGNRKNPSQSSGRRRLARTPSGFDALPSSLGRFGAPTLGEDNHVSSVDGRRAGLLEGTGSLTKTFSMRSATRCTARQPTTTTSSWWSAPPPPGTWLRSGSWTVTVTIRS